MALARKYLTSKRSAAATANTRKKHKLAVGCVGWSDVAVQLVGGTRGHGPVRFVCPTPTGPSTPADWCYPHERGAAANNPPCGSVGRVLSASNTRDMF